MRTRFTITCKTLLAACLPWITTLSLARDITLPANPKPDVLIEELEKVRVYRAGSQDASQINFHLETGEYFLTTPITLEPRDSNIAFVANPGSKPIIHGGRSITGWKVSGNGTWTAQIDPGWKFEALWVNGRRAVRARTPNKGFFQATGQPDTPINGLPLAGPASKTLIQVDPVYCNALGSLAPEEIQDVQVQVYHSWDVSRLRLAGVQAADGKLQFTGGVRDFFSLEPWQRLRFENYLGAMDEAGEWFLEKNGTLHYMPLPGETLEATRVIAPVAHQWVVLSGKPEAGEFVSNVRFEGISFEYQQWLTPARGMHAGQAENGLPSPAIEAKGIRNVRFVNCEFAHTMTHAAWLKAGCSHSRFEQCLFQDLGAGGVYVGDPVAKSEGPSHTHHISVENCIMRGGGRHFPAGIGVTLFHASDCLIRHCDIGDFYYSAISIGWTWGYAPTVAGRNLVEYCHLHHLGLGELSDLGAVYTLGKQLGTVIRNCRMHHIGCASYGAWAMYNDEGSTGVLWENNLTHDTQTAGYHQHYGRGNIVRNNILAWGRDEQIRRSKPEESFAFAFERNIVLLGASTLFNHLDKNWHDGRVFMADNVYWHAKTPPVNFAGKTWAEWQAAGNDVRSVIADPKFTDPLAGDWSLAADSPAIKLGFKPFDWSLAGVTGNAAWRKTASQPMPSNVFGEKPEIPALQLKQGFENFEVQKPAHIGRRNPNNPAIFTVKDIPDSDGKCIELRDAPDQTPAFEPHFFYAPGHTEGETHLSFDLRLEENFRFLHEWRDRETPYNTSVFLIIEKGAVLAGGKKLTQIPAAKWVRVEIKSKIGPNADGKWDLMITPKGEQVQRFEGLPPQKKALAELQWLGFISPGTLAAKAWIDNIELSNQ